MTRPPLLLLLGVAVALIGAAPNPLGGEAANCAIAERGPAVRISVVGLKDRRGVLRAELYPADDTDFLADDKILLDAGKVFRRVVEPAAGLVDLCIRVPAPGRYALAVLHARGGEMKFSPFRDGAGFANNPKLGFSKPSAHQATIVVGSGVTATTVVMNYWNGLSFGPRRPG